jgi:preprotein translocase SecE subunit
VSVADQDEPPIDEAAEQAHAESHAAGHSRFRFINFLRASWRELQRVQWPDRSHVAQATGVVLGFVVIAGTFLGVADYLSAKLMEIIL